MFAVTIPVEPTGGVTSDPCDVVADTKVMPAGSVSASDTPVALIGPFEFLTSIVYVVLSPTKIGSTESVFDTDRSMYLIAGIPFTEALPLPPAAGSHCDAVIEAVSLSVPSSRGFTVI